MSALTRSAGFVAGPLAWGISTQLAYSLSSQACDAQVRLLTPSLIALIALAALGAAVSATAAREAEGQGMDVRGGHAHRLVALIGAGVGALFALVICNQLAALYLLPPCLR